MTRAGVGPATEVPLALALIDATADPTADAVAVRVDGDETDAQITSLPFAEGSARSARLPEYPDAVES